MRRGFQLVAGVGLFPTNRCSRHRRADLGYAGNILPLLGIVLALGSVWAIIPAVAALIIAVNRTALEDRTLQEELPGYRDYMRRVRYRLIPGVY